jgi:hypothetical protein
MVVKRPVRRARRWARAIFRCSKSAEYVGVGVGDGN